VVEADQHGSGIALRSPRGEGRLARDFRARESRRVRPAVEHEPGRFLLRQDDGHVAELVYERRGGVLDIQHTYTPPALRGREIAARLTEAAFAFARSEGLRVVPTCSYTGGYVARHPEGRDLVEDA
jgi:predicted GNAT family acetyltransferase